RAARHCGSPDRASRASILAPHVRSAGKNRRDYRRRQGNRRGDGEAVRESRGEVHVLDIENGVDVTDAAAVNKQFEKIGAFDILVNNAGRAARKPAVELSKQEWDAVIALN